MTSILITGGAGSLGQALVKHLLAGTQYDRICIYSRDEFKHAEMAEKLADKRLRFFIGDVRDRDALVNAMGGVSHVIHAAALKRVDSVAYNPGEVIKTNVLGTMNVVEAAIRAEVNRVVVVSSDKAVNAENIYGASKFMAEQYAVAANAHGYPRGTRISCVRYGNVIGSRGSVVFAFKRAADDGLPMQITDGRCTRFWWTLGDASEFVMSALGDMQGGEVFIPKLKAMGILDFARAVSKTGVDVGNLRPGGEKLHESMMSDEETARAYDFGGQLLIPPALHPWRRDMRYEAPVVEHLKYSSDIAPWGWWTQTEMRETLQDEGLI